MQIYRNPLHKRSYCGISISFLPEATNFHPLEEALRGCARDQAPLRVGGFHLPLQIRAILPPKSPSRCVLQIEEDKQYKLASKGCLVILVCSRFCEIHSKINIGPNDLKFILLDLSCDALHLKNMNTHAIVLCFYL